jgi:hypothetical protein
MFHPKTTLACRAEGHSFCIFTRSNVSVGFAAAAAAASSILIDYCSSLPTNNRATEPV